MSDSYKLYHPKWHRRRMPIFWWLRRASYVKFILRELTSVPVLYTAILLLVQVWALARGGDTYARFTDALRHPAVLALNALMIVGVLFHTLTWLKLAPRAMVVEVRHRRLPDGVVLAAHYFAWLVVSAAIAWGLVGG